MVGKVVDRSPDHLGHVRHGLVAGAADQRGRAGVAVARPRLDELLRSVVLGRDLSEGSTILIDRRQELTGIEGEALVDIQVIEGEVKPEPVTVPPDDAPEIADDPAGENELS